MEIVIPILCMCFLSFMAGNILGYDAGMKAATKLYRKYM